MGILPVVGLEQVIAQSPALIGERVREQKKEEGSPEGARKAVTADEPVPPPASGVEPVHAIAPGETPEEGLEKEEKSEYPPGRKRGRRERRPGSAGGPERAGDGSKGHRLDIEA